MNRRAAIVDKRVSAQIAKQLAEWQAKTDLQYEIMGSEYFFSNVL